MADHNGAPPQMNLEEILRTLQGLQQTNTPKPDDQSILPVEPQAYHTTGAPNPYPPIETQHPVPDFQHADPRLNGRALPQQRAPTPVKPQPQKPPTPSIDTSSIVEWKHGLRAVNKIAAQNPSFESTIQKLIQDQKRNVRDWEAGRRRLLEEHKSKREIEQSQRAAISIPGLLDNAPLLRTPEREQEELDQYHHKVYRACKHMSVSHTNDLKRLGVPFFGTRTELIRADDEEVSSLGLEEDSVLGPDAEGKITKSQFEALQKKMLNHLVELYGD